MDVKTRNHVVLSIKIIIDFSMIVLFFLLSGYHLFENITHEWLGVSVFVLFLVHNALNWRWYKNLFKGKYNAVRIMQTVINFLLWIFMALNIASAIMISYDVFAPLGLSNGYVGRKMHLCATIWSFALVAFHFGMHFGMFIGMTKKMTNPSVKTATVMKWISRVVLLILCVFGIVVFIKRKLYNDMFLLEEFKFLDFGESKVKFFLDYTALFSLFSALGYYLRKLAMKARKQV